jgi:hypothetical protein
MDTIQLDYTYTQQEALRAAIVVTRDAFLKRRLKVWLGVMFFVAAIAALQPGQGRTLAAWMIGMAGCGFLLMWLLVRWSVARSFRKIPAANTRITWTISETQLETRGALGETTMQWSSIIKVRESRHGFVLFVQPSVGYWLPKRAFANASQVGQLRAWIRAGIVDFK